jgi:hypothetical protein
MDDAAAQLGQAWLRFVGWLVVTAAATAVTYELYARDLSNKQADYSVAVLALCAMGLAFLLTCFAAGHLRSLRKVVRAGRRATDRTYISGSR